MAVLYPSWIEIPVSELDRAEAFYRAVFGLEETPHDDDPPARIVVLLPSDKSVRAPGVSLVRSPAHTPSPHGAVVNFHLGDHAAMAAALEAVTRHGGRVLGQIIDTGDGVRYLSVHDSEGNTIALSSYEPAADAPD